MFALNLFVFGSLLVWCSAGNVDTKTSNVRVLKPTFPQNGSYFGYAVALHGYNFRGVVKSVLVTAPKTSNGGNLSECIFDHNQNKTCDPVPDISGPGVFTDKKVKQWLGASLYSAGFGKSVIVCAPRYVEEISQTPKQYRIPGKCFVMDDILRLQVPLTPCINPSGRDETFYEVCQAGLAVSYISKGSTNTALIGAVGSNAGKGSLIFQDTFTRFDQLDETDYLGYSVTHGNFYDKDKEMIAGGVPRANHTGKVMVYEVKGGTFEFRQVVNPPKKVKETKSFMYFGASVCAVDINNDGYSDLLVGAPFYSKKGDEGRVYVYLSQEIPSSGSRKLVSEYGENVDPGLRGNDQPGARFGWTIVPAGDIDDDGIEDVIIGAPHDGPDLDGDGVGNGAIYIYYGSKNGDIGKYYQRITAQDVQKFQPNLRQFGYSVAGNMDIDGNEYPDVAVGAWKSDTAILLRSKPVMDIVATLTLSTKEIPIDNFTANCQDGGEDKQCLNATVCFKYRGKGITGSRDIKCTLELDKGKTNKRLYFRDATTNKKIYERRELVTMPEKDRDICKNFSRIFVEGSEILQNSLQRGNDIVFEARYELPSRPECETSQLCPVLDKRLNVVIQEKATLILNCSDNTCDYDLNVKLSYDRNITVGKTNTIITEVILGNNEERAYNPEIRAKHDPSLQYENVIVPDESVRITRVLDSGNVSTTELFRLQGVLENRQQVVFQIQYSTRNVKGDKPQLSIEVEAEGNSGQETKKSDNKDVITVYVKREVIFKIESKSVPGAVTYPITPPAIGTPIGNRFNFSNVNASLVGPEVEMTFIVTNEGDSDLDNIKFTIVFPLRESGDDKEQDYIVYPVSLSVTEGNGKCGNDLNNPESLQNIGSQASTSRRKRDVESLSARSRVGGTLICNITELNRKKRFSVVFVTRFWVKTLAKYYPKDLELEVNTDAVYSDSLLQGRKTTERKRLKIPVTPENPAAEKDKTPVWVIIVSVLGGVLLLALVIFALFKFGFFKRNRPPKDISSPQSDVAAVIPT